MFLSSIPVAAAVQRQRKALPLWPYLPFYPTEPGVTAGAGQHCAYIGRSDPVGQSFGLGDLGVGNRGENPSDGKTAVQRASSRQRQPYLCNSQYYYLAYSGRHVSLVVATAAPGGATASAGRLPYTTGGRRNAAPTRCNACQVIQLIRLIQL